MKGVRFMQETSKRKMRPSEVLSEEKVRRRIFAVSRFHESEDARIREDAERAIRRVFAEWDDREGGRLPRIPTAVEELVRFYCLDYERREKALDAHAKASLAPERENARPTPTDNQSLHMNEDSRRKCTHRLHVVRKNGGKNALTAPVAVHYRRLNMLIDLSLSLACEEGVRATMRHDIAERRGDRRTALYYVDRRAYLRQKRKAKLAIAAALGLL